MGNDLYYQSPSQFQQHSPGSSGPQVEGSGRYPVWSHSLHTALPRHTALGPPAAWPGSGSYSLAEALQFAWAEDLRRMGTVVLDMAGSSSRGMSLAMLLA